MSRITTTLSEGPYVFDCAIARVDDALPTVPAESIFRAYLRFLKAVSLGTVRAFRTRTGAVELRFLTVVLLRFEDEEVAGTQGRWAIRGGLLAADESAGSVVIRSEAGVRFLDLVAFEPRVAMLPWVGATLYRWTQAPGHILITKRFLAGL